jgi:hypothetical protein
MKLDDFLDLDARRMRGLPTRHRHLYAWRFRTN